MAKNIKAATVVVSLEARSAKFTEALDRMQRHSQQSSSKIIRSLGDIQAFSKKFEQRVTTALFAPFKAFKKFTAPFVVGCNQIKATVKNLMRPFVSLATYMAGPFIKAFAKAKKGISALAGPLKKLAMGVTAGVASVAALIIGFSRAALETNKLARMIGVSYKEMNQLSFVAMDAGVSVQSLADGLKDLSAKATDASFAGSGPLEPFFKQINQSRDAWDKLDPIAKLEKYSDALSKVDYQTALYWADEVGGSMAEMTPLLHQGSAAFKKLRAESELFGGGFDNVDGLRELEKVTNRISFSLKNIFSGIGNSLAPVLLKIWDQSMVDFEQRLKALSPTGDAGEGFVKFANDIAGDVLIGTGKLLNGISSMVQSITNAFDGLVNLYNANPFANKILKGDDTDEIKDTKKQLYARQIASRELTTKGGSINGEQTKLDAFKKQNQQRGASRGWGDSGSMEWKSDDAKAEYEQRLADLKKQREAYHTAKDQILNSKTVKELQEILQQQIIAANTASDAILSNPDTGPSFGDDLIAQGNTVKTQTPSKKKELTPDELKNQAASNKVQNINKTFTDSLRGAGIDAKSGETNIDMYTDLLKKTQAATFDAEQERNKTIEKFAQQRVIIEAGSEREIALEKSRISDTTTQEEIEVIAANIERIKKQSSDAMAVIDLQAMNELDALRRKEQNKVNLTRDFALQVRDFKISIGQLEVDEQEERYNNELAQITSMYDQRIDYIANAYGIESEMYAEMLAEKKEALDGFRQAQADADVDQAQKEIANSEGTLERLATHLDGEYQQHADQKVGLGDMRLSDIEDASLSKQKLAEATKDGKRTEAQVEEEFRAKQKAGTFKLGGDLLAEGAKNNKTMFKMNQAMNIGNAIMDTYAGASKAYAQWGFPYGAIAAGLIVASGVANVAQIKSQKFQGKAHKGQTTIDGTGDQSWILQGGERVVSKEQNVDLKNYMQQSRNNKAQAANAALYLTVNVNDSKMPGEEVVQALETCIPRFRKLMDLAA
jgi:hypothetical protein